MSRVSALDILADHYGILPEFLDLTNQRQDTSRETKLALLRAQGLQLDNDAMITEALEQMQARQAQRQFPDELIVTARQSLALDLARADDWHLTLEGAAGIAMDGKAARPLVLPPLPPGLHTLTLRTGRHSHDVTLIAAPGNAPSVSDLTGQARIWGLNTALYGLRSGRNTGLGDYQDLAQMAKAISSHGAGFLGINPVHNLGWSDDQTISPYSPSHRGFLNTAHIAPDHIPGLDGSPGVADLLHSLEDDVAILRSGNRVDHTAHRAAIKPVLEALYRLFQDESGTAIQARFDDFCTSGGANLSDFTLFEALSERHGPDWRHWPAGVQTPDGSGTASARAALSARMRFHAWLQWVAHCQLTSAQNGARDAGMALGLYLDLAVGSRRNGAEAWCEADIIANGVSIGAPPDHLSPGGQNWNLAAYAPAKLTHGKYRAFRQVLRAIMSHAGLVRIDHVLGMNRFYWLPDDGSPGGYVRYPFDALRAIVLIEADQAKTAVIGEDLGLVPDGFRKAMRTSGIYGYSVGQYERDKKGTLRHPKDLRSHSLACFGTHDTPTLGGFAAGRDIDWWKKLGWIGAKQAAKARQHRKRDVAELCQWGATSSPDRSASFNLLDSVHYSMASAPAAMVSVQMDDLSGEVEAQNLPGTTDEHPNWRRRSGFMVEQMANHGALTKIGRIMADCGRQAIQVTEKETSR